MSLVRTHRNTALVLQGGGALGAFEAGTYQAIYRQAREQHDDGRLFDIVAGTSIGAINSAVLMGHYLRHNNSWEGSDRTLIEFWAGLATPTVADAILGGNTIARGWWDYLHSLNPSIADAESARRFWSIFEFSFTMSGVPNMYQPYPQWGSKFLNPFTDFLPWWRYDYHRLKSYLSRFVDFPIKTSVEEGQPRLLLTSVDVQDYTTAVVFDSYKKMHTPIALAGLEDAEQLVQDGGMWFTEYGTADDPHVLFYDGIGPDQVLASALGKYSLNHPTIEDAVTKTKRELWDGGYLSNTPLRELLIAHRKYWREYLRKNDKRSSEKLTRIPELEVYVVNLHPASATDIPRDKDSIDSRENDILFHDRTTFDEMVAYLRTDYVDLAWKLIELVSSHGLEGELESIMKKEAKSVARAGGEFKYMTYRDIVDGRTSISKVWRVDRRDSSSALFGKTTDFTQSSIMDLILEGEKDAVISLNKMRILFALEDLIADGIVAPKAGENAMQRIRTLVTAESFHKQTHEEILEAFKRYAMRAEELIPMSDRRQAVIEPARIIVEFLIGRPVSDFASMQATKDRSGVAS